MTRKGKTKDMRERERERRCIHYQIESASKMKLKASGPQLLTQGHVIQEENVPQ